MLLKTYIYIDYDLDCRVFVEAYIHTCVEHTVFGPALVAALYVCLVYACHIPGIYT